MLRAFYPILLVALVSACSSLPRQAEHLANAPSCCTSASQFKFEEMQKGRESSAPISETSTAFSFPTGKSYFVAYDLPSPDHTNPELMVKTYWAATKFEKPQVFCPSLTFYDASFREISTELLMLSYLRVEENGGGYWRSSVPIPPEARHVAVHTESRRIGNLLAVSTGETAPPLLILTPTFVYFDRGGPGQAQFQCGHIGNVTLTVTP